jgi:hypothetical protein
MKLRLTKSYYWYSPEETIKYVVTMYFVNGIPFTWDDLTEQEEASTLPYTEANSNVRVFTPEDLFRSSGYLIMEECHPCFFEMDLENPEMLSELE